MECVHTRKQAWVHIIHVNLIWNVQTASIVHEFWGVMSHVCAHINYGIM